MSKPSSEIKEIVELVTKLKNAKALVPRDELRTIVDNDKRLTRRLKTIKNTFTNLYLLQINGKGYRLISRKAEFNHKPSNKKLVLHTGINCSVEVLNAIIADANTAKEQNLQLLLYDYKGVSGKPPKDYCVTIIDLVIDNDPYILAVEDSNKTLIKTFKLSRAGRVVLTKAKGFAGGITAKNILRDDFGFLVDNPSKCRTVELLLTNYSMTMILHDFAHLVDKVTELKKAQVIKETVNGIIYEYAYRLQLTYLSVKPLRVVIGLLDHIKVCANKATLDEFRDFIKKTVLDSMGSNLI